MRVQILCKPGVTRGNLWQTPHRWSHTNQKIEENAGERESAELSGSHIICYQDYSTAAAAADLVILFRYSITDLSTCL